MYCYIGWTITQWQRIAADRHEAARLLAADPRSGTRPAHPACARPAARARCGRETTVLCGVARKLRRDRERQAEAALGVGPPFP